MHTALSTDATLSGGGGGGAHSAHEPVHSAHTGRRTQRTQARAHSANTRCTQRCCFVHKAEHEACTALLAARLAEICSNRFDNSSFEHSHTSQEERSVAPAQPIRKRAKAAGNANGAVVIPFESLHT